MCHTVCTRLPLQYKENRKLWNAGASSSEAEATNMTLLHLSSLCFFFKKTDVFLFFFVELVRHVSSAGVCCSNTTEIHTILCLCLHLSLLPLSLTLFFLLADIRWWQICCSVHLWRLWARQPALVLWPSAAPRRHQRSASFWQIPTWNRHKHTDFLEKCEFVVIFFFLNRC